MKRFSEFRELHNSIVNDKSSNSSQKAIDVSKLPKLPGKRLPGSRSLSSSLVEQRRLALETYMTCLLSDTATHCSVPLLRFLGICSVARNDDLNEYGEEGGGGVKKGGTSSSNSGKKTGERARKRKMRKG